MQGDGGTPLPWRRVHVVGLVLALLIAPIAPAAATTAPTDGTATPATIGGVTAAELTGFPLAPWVNNSDTSHDPTTTTSLSVAYNATGQVGSASDATVELYNATDGTFVTDNSSLTATDGSALLTVPAGAFTGDQSVAYRLTNASTGTVLATDTSMLLAGGGGGGDGGTARIAIDSVSLSSTTVTPGTNVDVDVTLNHTGGASASTTVEVFDVGTTESITTLASQSVSVGASTTTTTTLTVSLPESGLADLYVVGGTSFERATILVQPSNSLSVTGFSLSATTVEQNEDVDVTATVSNGGASDDWLLVPLYQDGSVTQVENVTVPAGSQKQVTITTTFANAGSHTVAVGGQSSTGVTVETRGSPAVVASSVRVVGGTQPSGDVIVGTTVTNGKLDVRLKAQGVQNGEADLANVGADNTTRFEVDLELDNFTPRMMMGTGGNVSWSVGPGTTADTANLTLTIEPRENQRFYYQDGSQPTYNNWPAKNKQATTMREAQALVSFYNMGSAPVRFRTTLTGGTIVTDAQSFSPPMYRQGSNTQKPRLTVQVAGPHFTVDGSQNRGYYEALIPDGMLEQWGVTSAGQLRAAYGGSQTQATFTRTSRGIKMKLDTHYSAETAEIRPAGDDTTTPTADAGSDHTVTAGNSVTFDASATTDNVGIKQYEWDFDGDGIYDTSTTSVSATHTYTSAGSVTATLRVTDGADNTDTDTVSVTVEATSGGGSNGGGSGGGSSGGGSSGGSSGDSDADGTGPSVDVSADARSASVGVVGARGSQAVDVAFTTPPSDAGVALDAMSVTAGGDFDLTVSVAGDESSLPEGTADVPPLPGDDGSSPVSYVSVEHPSLGDDDISDATFDISVETAALEERGTAPEDVVVYRHHEGAWTALDTRLVGSTDEAHRYAVDSPGLSVFAIAAGVPRFDVREASVAQTDLTVGDAVTVTATVENVGTAATRVVDLTPGETAEITFTVAPEGAGTYALRVGESVAGRVTVDGAVVAGTPTATATATATAKRTPESTAEPTARATATATEAQSPGFGAVVAVLAFFGAGLLARRRD